MDGTEGSCRVTITICNFCQHICNSWDFIFLLCVWRNKSRCSLWCSICTKSMYVPHPCYIHLWRMCWTTSSDCFFNSWFKAWKVFFRVTDSSKISFLLSPENVTHSVRKTWSFDVCVTQFVVSPHFLFDMPFRSINFDSMPWTLWKCLCHNVE